MRRMTRISIEQWGQPHEPTRAEQRACPESVRRKRQGGRPWDWRPFGWHQIAWVAARAASGSRSGKYSRQRASTRRAVSGAGSTSFG
jgi:hypothetical protein